MLRAGLQNVQNHFDEAVRHRPDLATDVPYVRIGVAKGAMVQDQELERVGLVPVLWREDNVVAAYTPERDLRTITTKINAYGQERAKLATLAKLEHLAPWTREDRTSEALRRLKLDPTEHYVVDVTMLPLANEESNEAGLAPIEAFVVRRGGRIVDRAVGRAFTAFRTRMRGQALDDLLEYRDDVAWIDLPPRPVVGVPARHTLKLTDLPDIPSPEPTAPALCVVDSGIVEGHPLLEPAVLSALSRSFPPTIGPPVPTPPAAGHGTHVAGIAAYSDLSEPIRRRSFVPDIWLVNARVLDDNNELDPDRMPFMREIVEHVGRRCRVFNLSFGSPREDDNLTLWAAELDELARSSNALFVVASGNHFPPAHPTEPYPDFMDSAEWRVLTPAESLNALSVGGIATDGDPHPAHRWTTAVGQKNAPSPFSCHGGLKNVVKPELVEIGGTVAVHDDGGRWVTNDAGLGVPTTNPNFAGGLLVGHAVGTSFAAPKVAHLAARVVARYPEATPNLIRALLVQSASPPQAVQDWPRDRVMRLCGFGVPDADRALVCRPRRATLFAESRVDVDEVGLFDVPVPKEFASAKGKKRIIVTIAWDPPVSLAHRDRPVGVQLTWGLVRGDVPDEK
ncbi:MAG: S8 family peptidase, partial [Deltaproteobacteria bacterium]|nr:S8 family peptidase [Deltaproteobacteria bacterium]